MFWCACLMSIGIFVSMFSRGPFPPGLMLLAAIQWIMFVKYESDLRLLKVIDRLHR